MNEVTKKFTIAQGDDKKHRLVCRECGRDTLHSIICSYDENSSVNSVDWHRKNQIIQCLGCETVSFRTVSTFSEDVEYDYTGDPYWPETIKYYPGRAEGLKSIDSYLLPYSIQQIYKETILSIENEQYILAGIGIRAIVETICKDLNADGRNLYEKIDSLKNKSIVTTEGAAILHKLRVLGNDAAHEVKAHNSRQLELAMQIIEHMLDGTYVIPARVQP
ncbi:MAG: DUF4145 domain-containing protein, partial [Candidatus Electrothrix sp. AUS4]|nr:DUF4145 domain-containing protein [Candidatus Electrothrix sp. AUS4]